MNCINIHCTDITIKYYNISCIIQLFIKTSNYVQTATVQYRIISQNKNFHLAMQMRYQLVMKCWFMKRMD